MAIQIIGAGFPRTGTTTLKRSLEILGFEKCYHMKELLLNPDMLPYWQELEKTGSTDWDTLYEGYVGSVDFPCYPFYKAHMERYPDAKVILTVRPFESWYNSLYTTVWQAGPQNLQQKLVMMAKMAFNPRLRKVINCIKFVRGFLWEKQFEGKFEDKAFVEEIFRDYIESVKAFVPADKLLVYDVRDGWEPLCTFLGVPVPDEPLPHLNKKENFKSMLGELVKGNRI
ncbi:sulfotransferase family protein [Flavilitoribacter nigricans]|uniref:Sulfotransferase family protein n=1 Tax=Flavilitoribacter nigricans (strain ATCC 23147 / DSM 23189 / NBRC 102662 / NCIMB 1420 / SS-2) TaxID=1122177 RepID=A0A2D0N0Z4_FLAN2|nr:sulfotransferase family protein [Flavilitoribacter nigricans]PHN02048.1 sulfotransferase family protein [Flavilitoribacter nigricans DSM 23189 = NBRC 102662]